MEIQRKWQGEVQDVGEVELKHADWFTKPLSRDRFE